MAVILWLMSVSLLMHSSLCSLGETKGCMKWNGSGDNVCCEACHPGHRLVKKCGPVPQDLCVPCEPGTYTMQPAVFKCQRCTVCVGAQVQETACTATTDTQCRCKKGLACGDARCSFCVDECDRGQEPTKDRSCRKCPNGTFNDQVHQKCKPWSTKCPHPDQKIVSFGDAFNDIKCDNVTLVPSISHPNRPDHTDQVWPLIITASAVTLAISFFIITAVMARIYQKKRESKTKTTKTTKTPIIRTPTDDPRTLIAIECSFHEAQQEQGSSSESLASKDSSEQLIA